MTDFIQTTENAKDFVCVYTGTSIHTEEVVKETDSRIKTERRSFRKSDGREIGGDSYRRCQLITKEDYLKRRGDYLDQRINRAKREQEELQKQLGKLDIEIAEYQKKKDNPPF